MIRAKFTFSTTSTTLTPSLFHDVQERTFRFIFFRVYAIENGEVLADAIDFDVDGTLTNYVEIFSSRRQTLPVRSLK